MKADSFARDLLRWYTRAGRKDLPWQQQPTPYRVWVSEIMLQQTRVETVIPYYRRFMSRYPTVSDLAGASLDQVLHSWSGLGYYARARNLHATACRVAAQHAGRFPDTLEGLMALPGIGRSTAGAILALACHQRQPILDGNVKRVLARYHALAGWPGQTRVQHALWELAEQHTPQQRVAEYTQAIMDLGATVCTRTRPACTSCPLQRGCSARRSGRQTEYPAPRPTRPLPVRQVRMLLLDNAGAVLLQQRPPSGIWGGLWSLPELPERVAVERWCRDALGLDVAMQEQWPVLRHTFSHFHLDITPLVLLARDGRGGIMDPGTGIWHRPDSLQELGMAAPVERLLQRFCAWQQERTEHDQNGTMREARQTGRGSGQADLSR